LVKHAKQLHPEDDCTVSVEGEVDQMMDVVTKAVGKSELSSSEVI